MGDVRLLPEAEIDLENIWLTGFERWGLEQADRYQDQLNMAFETVLASPELGKSCDDILEGTRFYLEGRHVIYYRKAKTGIVIIRILHDRMLPSRHL